MSKQREQPEEWSTVELDITDQEFNELAHEAHERNITFNQLVVDLLQQYVDSVTVVD